MVAVFLKRQLNAHPLSSIAQQPQCDDLGFQRCGDGTAHRRGSQRCHRVKILPQGEQTTPTQQVGVRRQIIVVEHLVQHVDRWFVQTRVEHRLGKYHLEVYQRRVAFEPRGRHPFCGMPNHFGCD